MQDFKTKAISSTIWSFLDTFGNQGIQFGIGIILARLLIPEDYGIIGVLAIFTGIAGVLVDSGFKTSIIRSNNITEKDCSTIFFVNLFVSIIISTVLYLSANSIAGYFEKPELINVVKTFSILPIINGLGLVQSALLFKNLQFKRNAKISITANIISGLIAVYLAFKGFSYWALVWKVFLVTVIYNMLLWMTSKWKPMLFFSFAILKKHFKFSSKLLVNGVISSLFNNIYTFVFGKFFSFAELGFFTRGKGYSEMFTKTISIAIQKVNTPLIAASGKNDNEKIHIYLKLLRASTLLVFPVAIFLVVVAEPMIIFLIGEKWRPAIPFLQILTISGMIYPILNANFALYEVLGRSDIILKQTLIIRPVTIFILFFTVQFNATMVAWGIVLVSIIGAILSFYFVKKISNIRFLQLLKTLLQPLYISLLIGIVVFCIGFVLKKNLATGIVLGVQIIFGFIITIILFYVLKIEEFKTIKQFLITNSKMYLKKTGIIR